MEIFLVMQRKTENISISELPAIIIIAHDRPKSLKRLLKSIDNASFPKKEIDLIFSIDKSDNSEIVNIAAEFDWKHGNKKIIEHDKHLGLKDHVFSCGKLIQDIGPSILLEDDLVVAPYFYFYAIEANSFYQTDKNIAGMSLYGYSITENSAYPFYPNDDGFDNYFMQIPSSWGQLFTAEHWNQFFEWLENTEMPNSIYPEYIKDWGKKSWKKFYMKYLIDTNRYFVFPRKSHTTNFEDRGTHAKANGQFQVELQDYNKVYNFSFLTQSKSKYDAWFELEQEIIKEKVPMLSSYDFTVDLYGSKLKSTKKEYTLSTKEGSNPLFSFGGNMSPLIQNVFYQVEGSIINFLKSYDESERIINPSIFYPLNTVAENNINKALSQKLKIGIVIPLLNWNEIELIRLLESLEEQVEDSWECLLVTSNKNISELEVILRKSQCSNRIKLLNFEGNTPTLFDLINFGFNKSSGNILSWSNPQSVFSKNELKTTISLFTDFKPVKFLKQIHEKNALEYKWNESLLNHKILGNKHKISTEKFFIASHVWRDLGKTFNNNLNLSEEEFWMLKAIKKYPLFLFLNQTLDSNQELTSKKISNKETNKLKKALNKNKTSKSKLLSSIFKYFYIYNIPYLRAFYGLYHNLNDVIRYDEANDSYYFDRY